MNWQDEQKRVATGVTGADDSVTWGVDWGKVGDTPCVSIIKRLPDGRIKVIAVEYAPYSHANTQPKREWVGLTDAEIDQGLLRTPYTITAEAWREGVRWAYHQLKEKNT